MLHKKIDILNGNELIIQGALEAGFHLYTGYPGSPLADYFNILHHRKDEFQKKGIRVVIANSEANAAAMASGAKQAHKDCIVAMKSMGLHVASDALSVGNFANPGTGAVVVVVGDDPWSISTSSPADSRFLFKHLHIPFLDPSTPQELKDWIKIAKEISKQTSVYQGVLLTTFMAEGGGRVEINEESKINSDLITLDPATFDLSKNVMVPPNSYRADISMINERFPKVYDVLKSIKLDKIFGKTSSKTGLITSGAVFEILKHVLDDSEALEQVSLYKIGAPYPLVEDLLIPYLKNLDNLIIVEEKRGFLEQELSELILKNNLKIKILGKKFNNDEGFPAHGGLNYEIVFEKLSKAFTLLELGPCHDNKNKKISSLNLTLPRRLPTFCPGCPHRETLSLLKDLRIKLKKENINLISHGDVGCYSLSFLEPFKEMHNLSAMGQGGALGAGVDLFTTNPSVVLMGDSTFFHSGITDISNSVQLDHNITYILLDNDNTAMTGHQMSPSTGESVEGFKRPAQDMMNLVKSFGVEAVIEVNPSDRYFYQNILSEMIFKKGVKVIISNKECGLTFHGRKKSFERKEFQKGEVIPVQTFYQINTDACEDCRVCVEMTGCPGLTQVFDAYGTKVAIDSQICVADSYCTKIKACPSFEKVDVFNYHPTKYKNTSKTKINFETLPLPQLKKDLNSIASGSDYRLVITGVGGTGITTISKILSTAAFHMDGRSDIDFKFVDQKGLAQRNGNVTSHLMLFKKGKSQSQITPLGGADLLLSPDLLDGSQHLGFLNESSALILDKKFQVPLSILLDLGESAKVINEEILQAKLSTHFSDRLTLLDLKDLSEKVLGKSVYSSAMILGAAFQKGYIPFSLNELLEAIKLSVPKMEIENNTEAFMLGRLMIDRPLESKKLLDGDKTTLSMSEIHDQLIHSINSSFLFYHSRLDFEKRALELKDVFIDSIVDKEIYLVFLHDLMVFDKGIYFNDYLLSLKKLKEIYQSKLQSEEFLSAVRTLTKTFFIKDEIFIAHQMISQKRKLIDQSMYQNLGTHYKKSFINRPSFDLTKNKKIEFDFSPTPMMLKILRHMRFLRKILAHWHSKEKFIQNELRTKLLSNALDYTELRKLENIKGYRNVRYESFGI
jgi:indolepyruvate ferredoxin oxidoreductase